MIKLIKNIFFDPWAKNVPTYSWWQLGVHSIPYDLPKKHYGPLSPGGEVPLPLAEMTPLYFFINFCPILSNKWPNFWYLRFLFQLNVFIGYIYHNYLLVWAKKEFCNFHILGIFWPYYKYSRIPVYFSLIKWRGTTSPPLPGTKVCDVFWKVIGCRKQS